MIKNKNNIGGYTIGTECYGLITTPNEPDFILPVQLIILEKYKMGSRNMYKVKIKDIYETDFNYLKEYMYRLRLLTTLTGEKGQRNFIPKSKMSEFENKFELLNYLNDCPFFLEENYITINKEDLRELYYKFVKYLVNYHYEKLFTLSSRSFMANSPFFENQKDMFLKRIRKIGFADVFDKFELELDI